MDDLVLYGILRRGQPGYERLRLAGRLHFVDHCEVVGAIYDLGGYPGLKLEPAGRVRGELYRLADVSLFDVLDEYEQYDPADPEGSVYLRRRVPLVGRTGEAWIYVYNRPIGGAVRIPSGDWIRHV